MPDNPYDPIDEYDQWKAWQDANANAPAGPAGPSSTLAPGNSETYTSSGSTRTGAAGGGGGGGTYLSREDYRARNLQERRDEQLARGYQAQPPAGSRIIGTNPYGSPQVT